MRRFAIHCILFISFLLLRVILLPGVVFSQSSTPDYERISKNILLTEFKNGEQTIILSDTTLCTFTYDNGILNGLWSSKYPNGKTKTVGQFCNNVMCGKWKLFAPNGKRFVVIEFDSVGQYHLKRIRKGFLNNSVKWGRGEIRYCASYDHILAQNALFSGKIKYVHGKKTGQVTEYYADGQKRAQLNYKDGLFDGTFQLWDNLGQLKLDAEYSNGIPVGKWTYFYNGNIVRTSDYNIEAFRVRIPGHLFTGEHEVITNQRQMVVVPVGHPANDVLFKKDSAGKSFYSILDYAFAFDETVFFTDRTLQTPLFPSAARPEISGLRKEFLRNAVPVYIIYTKDQYFSSQHSNQRNSIIALSMVIQYTNEKQEKIYTCLPWAYFPQMYDELKSKTIHNMLLSDVLNNLLLDRYFSLPVYLNNINDVYLYESTDQNSCTWIEQAYIFKLEWINNVHSLLLTQTGLICAE